MDRATARLTKTQVAKLMAANGIAGELTGRGTRWEVTLNDEKAMRKFCRKVANVGGHNSQCGEWMLRPGYVAMGDFNDKASAWHY